jgi:hypothetical protein
MFRGPTRGVVDITGNAEAKVIDLCTRQPAHSKSAGEIPESPTGPVTTTVKINRLIVYLLK